MESPESDAASGVLSAAWHHRAMIARVRAIDPAGQEGKVQQATIATGIVAGFAMFLDRQGVAADALLDRVGIDTADLADPDGRLPLTPLCQAGAAGPAGERRQ